MTRSGIYRIRCIVNGKIYIGSAVNVRARWSVHKHLLRRGRHSSVHMQRAWDKYGETAFVLELIESVDDVRSLVAREQHHIDLEAPFGQRGYNIAPLAGRTAGAKRTPEQIERMAARFRGKPLSEGHRNAISEGLRGRRHRPETIEKISAAQTISNGQRGRPLTENQKRVLHRKGAEHPWYGRRHSDATRQRMSADRSRAVIQVTPDGDERLWSAASQAAEALGLKSADTIWRAVNNPTKRAAGCLWRRCTDRAVVS